MNESSYTLLYIWVLGIVVVLFTGCDDRRTYSHYAPADVERWEQRDTLLFAVPPQHAGSYVLQLSLRATEAYPFTHLSMFVERTIFHATAKKGKQPKAPSVSTFLPGQVHGDTVRCQITDDDGHLLGKNGISSTELSYDLPLLHLQEGDSMAIKIHHCMKRDPLQGISDVGITLATAE